MAILVLLVCVSGRVTAQDALAPVRELYASADYEGALSALGRLKAGSRTGNTLEMDRYQVLCLVALGRTEEADTVIEAILTQDPQYDPADAPPRIRAAFKRIRQRVVPGVARKIYADGKAAYDRKAFAEAVQKLERTLQIVDSPHVEPQADLTDLRTVAAGFLDLSRTALAQARAEATARAEASARPSTGAPVGSRPVPVPLPPPTDPVVLWQELPAWSGAQARGVFSAEFRGVIEVEIDEKGLVSGVQITEPIHPSYDPLLLEAAREWKYEPARRNGLPVKTRKRVDIVLRPR